MPSGDGRWAELASQHERVIRPADPQISSAVGARWDELASHQERLVDSADLPVPQPRGRLARTAMRLVAGAA